MPVRDLLIALVVLGVLAGGVYWSQRNESAEEVKKAAGGETKLVNVQADDVQKIQVETRGSTPLVLERDKSGQWQMLAPETWRTDQSQVGGLASAYASLHYDRIVEEKATSIADYGLEPPDAALTFTAKDGSARKLLIGDETPTGASVYAKLAGDPRVFTIDTNTKSTLTQAPRDLRDKRLLVFDAENLKRVTLASDKGQVEFSRTDGNAWRIVKPAEFRADNLRVEELVRNLGETRMDTTVPEEEAAKASSAFAAGSRVGVATVADSSGEQTIEVRKRGDEYFARSSSTPGFFKISSESGEALNKGLDEFRNRKLFDFGFNDPSNVYMRDGEKKYALQKSGDKWWLNGKQMDATSVQSLIDRLRDLSAIEFVKSRFTEPLIEIVVTSGEDKRAERVQISKTRESFFAKRQDEPAIYQLDPKAVQELQQAAADVKESPPPTAK